MPSEKDVRVRVGGIIINDNRLLLISHKKDEDVYWLLPGGGVDFGESLEEALKREFREELNITIRVHDIALVCDSIDPSGGRHIVNICFNCSHDNGEYAIGDEERLYDYAFFNRDELSSIKIYPPMNNELISMLDAHTERIYLGRIWLNR